jgi:hypothetical protein
MSSSAEHDLHVVLGEEQRQATLAGDAFEEADGFVRLRRRHPRGRLVEQ